MVTNGLPKIQRGWAAMEKSKKVGHVGVYLNHIMTEGKPDVSLYIIYKDSGGKNIKEKIGKKSDGYTEQYAKNKRDERIQQVRHGETVKPKSYTLNKLFDDYYYPHAEKSKTDHHKDKERYDKRIRDKLGNIKVDKLTTESILSLKNDMQAEGLKPATVNHYLKVLRQLLNYTRGLGLHSVKNPFKSGKLDQGISLDNPHNEKTRFLQKDELKKLLAELKKQDVYTYRLAVVGLYTGMRRGEVLNLKLSNIDWGNKCINLSKDDTKHGIARSIPMHEKTSNIITEISKENELSNGDLIFKRNGVKLPKIPDSFKAAVDKLQLNENVPDNQKVTYHTLRHTFASYLAMQGTPIVTLQNLLGHTVLTTTMRYAHLIPDKSSQYINNLDFS